MKSFIALILITLITFRLTAQEIPVRHEQEGSNIVIHYDLPGNPGDTYNIVVTCSENGGVTYGQPLRSLSGDAGPGIRPGQGKRITWSVVSDRDILEGNLKFKVTAPEQVTEPRAGQ